jgi:hypothetical protein
LKYNKPIYTPYNVTIDDLNVTNYKLTYEEIKDIPNETDYFIIVKKGLSYSINDGIYIDYSSHNSLTQPKHIQ